LELNVTKDGYEFDTIVIISESASIYVGSLYDTEVPKYTF